MNAPSPSVVGLRFRRAGKLYFFDAAGHPPIAAGDRVVVDTVRGRELGEVVVAPGQVVGVAPADLKPILRRATWQDLADLARQALDAEKVLATVRAEVAARELPVKPVKVEYSFDGSRLTVYFVSEEARVDMRDLARVLAQRLQARVNLRQIGARDGAKLLGGIDRCGRELCCSTWITDFQPISIRMAKHQNLPLNPSEISGVCGKLLCCLAFEDESYREMRRGLPKVGAKLTSAVGRGRVVDVNILTRKVTILWETGTRVEVDADELAEQQSRRAQVMGEAGSEDGVAEAG